MAGQNYADMVKSNDETVRREAASDRMCPEDALRVLAKDEVAKVRECVAKNRACPADVLQDLLNDEDAGVRMRAA